MRAALLIVLALGSPARAQTAEEMVAALASRALAGKLQVGRATLGNTIELDDVTIRDADGEVALRFGKVRLDGSVASIYGAGVIDAVEVEGVAIKLRQLPSGRIGIGRIVKDAQGGGGSLALKRVRVRGPVVLGIPGQSPRTLKLDLSASLQRADGVTSIELAQFLVTLDTLVVGGKGAVQLDGKSPALSLRGRASEKKSEIEWDLRLQGDELRAHATHAASGAQGSARLDLRTLRLSFDADARPLTLAQARAADVSLRGELDLEKKSGEIKLSARDAVAGGVALGALQAIVSSNGSRITLSAASDAARVEAEAVPVWQGYRLESADGQLSALRLEGRGQSWSLQKPARIRWGKALVLEELTLHHEPDERVSVSGRLELRASKMDLSISGKQLALSTIAQALGAQLALPQVRVDVYARARGALASPTVHVTVDGTAPPDPRIGRGAASVHAVARYARGRLSGSGDVRSGDASFSSTFELASRVSVRAQARAIPLSWAQPLVPGLPLSGSATLDLEISGTRADPRLVASASAQVAAGGSIDARIKMPLVRHAVVPLDGELRVKALALRGFTLDGQLQLAGRSDDPLLTGRAAARGPSPLGELKADSTLRWQRVLEGSLEAQLGGTPLLHGRGSLALALASLLSGGLDENALLSFDGHLPGFDLGRLAPLGGTLAGTLTVRSPVREPVLRAALAVRELLLAGSSLGPATAEATLDVSGASARLIALPRSGGSLRADAEARRGRRALRLVADRVHLDVGDAAGRSAVSGVLEGDVSLVYDGGARPSGTVRFHDGAVRVPGQLLDGLSLSARVEPGRLTIEELALKQRIGGLTASGTIGLDGLKPIALSARVRARELSLARDNFGVWLDTDASVDLKRAGEGVAGKLVVHSGRAHVVHAGLGRSLQPVGKLEDVTIVDRRKPVQAPVTVSLPRVAIPLLLAVEIPGPFRLISQELDVGARASLRLDTRGEPRLSGRVEALPGGRLELFDRRYDIERARISLGAAGAELDLRVTREIGDVLVALELSGPIDSPRQKLISDPPVYDETQIGGLVMSGDARTSTGSRAQIGEQLVGVITGVMGGRVLEKSALPIDVLKVEPGATASSPSRLEVGKYVFRDRVYVSYVYQFGGLTLPTRRLNAHQAQVQLRLVRRLSLDARYGDAGVGALDLTFTLRR